jgi:hypothetical protein
VRDDSRVYAVTVRGNAGDQVVYLNSEGAIVQPSSGTTATTTTAVRQPTQTTEPVVEGAVVTYLQIQQDQPRYQLLEKKGKEVYLDRKTGQKVTVKQESD